MAANFLGLFFLIIGTAGISNVFSLKEFVDGNKRSSSFWLGNSFDLNSFRGRSDALCRYKYGPFLCRNIIYDPPYFRLETDHFKKNYPTWQNPYFRQGQSFENPFSDFIYDPYESSEENTSEHEDTIESHVNNEQSISDYNRASTISPSSGNPTESNAYSKSNTPATASDGVHFESNFHVTRKTPSGMTEFNKNSRVADKTSNPETFKIKYRTSVEPQQTSSSFPKEETVELIEDDNMLTTSDKSSEGGTMESSMSPFTILETKRFPFKKTSSLEEHLNKPTEKNLQAESRLIQDYTEIHSITNKEASTLADKSSSSDGIKTIENHYSTMIPDFGKRSQIFQNLFLFTTREATYLHNKSNSPNSIQHTIDEEAKLESSTSQSSSIITDEGNSLKTKSSSSERIYPVNTQNLDIQSGTSLNSKTVTQDDVASQSKLSSLLETQSTTATTENSILSNKGTSISFTDKVAEDNKKETFSTKSSSLKIHFTQQAITQDHIIEISSIRTARIVVTSVFLVIALTALTLLAVFMFRLRRREVEYDQLMLIS